MINDIAGDAARRAVLRRLIASLACKGRCILVLSDRVELTTQLAEWVREDCAAHEEVVVSAITGQTPKKIRPQLIGDARILLATTGIAKLGLDKPALDTVIFATPIAGKSVEQPIGRILRGVKGSHSPLIIDVVDCYSIFHHFAKSRLQYYKRNGYRVQTCTAEESGDLF